MTIYTFGRPASVWDTWTIADVVKRYYKAAAATDGAGGCALTLSSLAKALPANYGGMSGPIYLRGGKTCATVMSKIFEHSHHELTGPTEVTGVRTKGDEALVLLSSRTLRFAYTNLERKHGVWRFAVLVGSRLP